MSGTGHLELRGVSKKFGNFEAVERLSFSVEPGQMVALLGPSGCGKTTTLKMIAGIEQPTTGAVVIDGADVTGREPTARGTGLVFQDFALFPSMTVAENLGFAPRMRGVGAAEVEQAVLETARTLEIEDLLRVRPAKLNASEMQRVSIGRTLVAQPRIVLFDEPLSNVEAGMRARMRGELRRLHRRYEQTSVYVTHDQVEAMALADSVAVMDRGRLVQKGSPRELYDNPASTFVATFIGSPPMNVVDAAISAGEAVAGGLAVPLPWQVAEKVKGADLSIGVRPEALRLGEPGSDSSVAFPGMVTNIEPLGAETLLRVDVDGITLTILEEASESVASIEERVMLHAPPSAFYWFGPDGQRISIGTAANEDEKAKQWLR